MSLTIFCPHCGHPNSRDTVADHALVCGNCEREVTVPPPLPKSAESGLRNEWRKGAMNPRQWLWAVGGLGFAIMMLIFVMFWIDSTAGLNTSGDAEEALAEIGVMAHLVHVEPSYVIAKVGKADLKGKDSRIGDYVIGCMVETTIVCRPNPDHNGACPTSFKVETILKSPNEKKARWSATTQKEFVAMPEGTLLPVSFFAPAKLRGKGRMIVMLVAADSTREKIISISNHLEFNVQFYVR